MKIKLEENCFIQRATIAVITMLLLCAATSFAQTPLPSGTYNFKDASGNTWDGGFNRANSSDPHMYLYSYNNGPDQQFIWNGSTLQEVADGEHVFNGSGALEVGSTSGTFMITTSGSGYAIKDVASGLYVNSPNAQYPATMGLSSSPTVWTAVNVGGSSLPSGTYNFKDASGNTWDGGFNRSNPGDPHMYLYSFNNGADQQFTWNGSTLQEVADGEHVFNGSGALEVGSTSGTFMITTSGSGYAIKDVASGLYVNSPNAQYPATMGLSSTPTVWTAVNVAGGGNTKINDNHASIVYSLGLSPQYCSSSTNWCPFSGSADYNSDEHSSQLSRASGSNFQGASMAVTFNGTGISWIGKKGPNYGTALWSLDGNTSKDGTHSGIFNGFTSTEMDQNTNLSLASLSPGYHVLYLGLQSPTNGSDHWQTIDAFQITGTPVSLSAGSRIGYNTTPQLQSILHGSWSCGASQTDLSGGHCYSWTTGDYMQWSFTGSLIEVYGRPDSENGYMDVSIDGGTATRVDLGLGTVDDDAFNGTLIFAKPLSSGSHTIKISVEGAYDGFAPPLPNCGGNNHCVQIDELVAF